MRRGPRLADDTTSQNTLTEATIPAGVLSWRQAYCSCSTRYNPNVPNANICPICTGEPGTLPLPNQKVRGGNGINGSQEENTMCDRNACCCGRLSWDRPFCPALNPPKEEIQHPRPLVAKICIRLRR
jgi:hypothetical protein